MSSRQCDFIFFENLIFIEEAAVPSVYDEKNHDFPVFPVFLQKSWILKASRGLEISYKTTLTTKPHLTQCPNDPPD